MLKWLSGLVDSNDKEINRLQGVVDETNSLEAEFEALSDEALKARTGELKSRLAEATSRAKEEHQQACDELTKTRQKLNSAANELEREDLDKECQRWQQRATDLDRALQKEEKEALNEVLPEAFAAVREAAKRTIRQRHFDVQLMGGIVLHEGKIAEMKTGEGKTLVATLPLYLNSLTGRGCHLATVNDYLARRDPYWMGPIYDALGVKVASIFPQTASEYSPARLYDPAFNSGDPRWAHFRTIPRQEAYRADITYGTSAEFGFDFLRDNMVLDLAQCVQRPLNYAIVDEVDNLLIDEARTPLIISGPDVESGPKYQLFARLVTNLKKGQDYEVKEKERSVELNDEGYAKVERLLVQQGLAEAGNLYGSPELMRHLYNALNAKEMYLKDTHYVVKDQGGTPAVIIVDEFTGRLMYGRRYSEGLHQAIEAKEHVKIQQETKTYATITIQNYFRMYNKLGGMTGTALTEAEEFFKIYKLEVVAIPTNKPMVREDCPDQIYKSEDGKFRAVVGEIKQMHEAGRPVLVGTVSIEKSERLGEILKRQGVPFQILNAKLHEKEASIIAHAGEPGAVTVATNMAGRGVDIILGGSPESQSAPEWQQKHEKIVALGGLHIVGTERHEARRIDNQLRGRSGRQGDPGSSRFYISLEDDIMRRFGGDRIKGFMQWAGMDDDTPIENNLITRAITDVQKRVEGYNFDVRKHLVEYDDVVNKHRDVIYGERRKILSGADLKSNILDVVREEIAIAVGNYLPDEHGVNWNLPSLIGEISGIFPLPPTLDAEELGKMSRKEITDRLIQEANNLYEAREKEMERMQPQLMRRIEKEIMLRTIDTLWIEHLTLMENMRQGIGLEAVGQRDPLVAYKSRGYESFNNLMSAIQHDVARTIFHVKVEKQEGPKPAPSPMAKVAAPKSPAARPQQRVGGGKVGRNDPCPCGSGKKFKHCCGRNA